MHFRRKIDQFEYVRDKQNDMVTLNFKKEPAINYEYYPKQPVMPWPNKTEFSVVKIKVGKFFETDRCR